MPRFKSRDYNFLIALIAILYLVGAFIPALPQHSATFDCDDSTLAMYHHFTNLGFNAVPMAGDLHQSGETYTNTNHAWLIVDIYGKTIAYDWGMPRFDPQHYEGYPLTIEELQWHVEHDSIIAALNGR